MAVTARKTTRNDDIKKILPMVESIDSAEKTEKALHTIERNGLENGIHVARDYCAMLKKLGDIMPGMTEFATDNEKTMNTICRVGVEWIESTHKAAEDLVLISRELMDCTSFDQFYTVQHMATNQLSKRWMEEASRMHCMLFGGFGTGCMLPPD